MSIFSDIQTAVASRINAHADLTGLDVHSELTADLDETIGDSIRSEGICAAIIVDGMSEGEADGMKVVRFAIEIHEDTETNVGLSALDVIERICFEQLKGWKPDTVYQEVQNIEFQTLEISPHVIREITAETRIFIP